MFRENGLMGTVVSFGIMFASLTPKALVREVGLVSTDIAGALRHLP